MQKLTIYNSLTRKKENFKPIKPPFVGLYVCGPTVYGEPHLGHARSAITFDLVYRYLMHLGYKVRYVRNITDVGHLENDAEEGEDKIAKKARIEQLEPMEVAQHYTNLFHQSIDKLNVLRPSIEPHASGHIIEQMAIIEKILENGFAYEVNGSVYFDVNKYHEHFKNYGQLSGRKIEDLISNTRELDGQIEKKSPLDFALWKKAADEHIMKWSSPWSLGFPGWHLECTAMGTKYLGETFDIHGGGIDLKFPHHECEIAQSFAATKQQQVNYWMHNNLITINNGQKMSKSLNNFITLNEFFDGNHKLLEKDYTPMTIRFFILQAHYRSTLDFSNQALQASEKGFNRLFNGFKNIQKIQPAEKDTIDFSVIEKNIYQSLNDDLNTPILIANLFDGIKMINSAVAGLEKITSRQKEYIYNLYSTILFDVLGLKDEEKIAVSNNDTDNLMDLIIGIRQKARESKNYDIADFIRDNLGNAGFVLKDSKDGTTWDKN